MKQQARDNGVWDKIMGNLLYIHVHAANIHDTKGGMYTFKKAFSKNLAKLDNFAVRSCDLEVLYAMLPEGQKVNGIFLVVQSQCTDFLISGFNVLDINRQMIPCPVCIDA